MYDYLIEMVEEGLAAELGVVPADADRELLHQKVAAACDEIADRRAYPDTYTDAVKAADLQRYKSNIRRLALYDYNQAGVEGQTARTEGGVQMTWDEREKCFSGVLPIARVM